VVVVVVVVVVVSSSEFSSSSSSSSSNSGSNSTKQFIFPCHILSHSDTFSFKISFTCLTLYNLRNFCSFL